MKVGVGLPAVFCSETVNDLLPRRQLNLVRAKLQIVNGLDSVQFLQSHVGREPNPRRMALRPTHDSHGAQEPFSSLGILTVNLGRG
jgi:hypothetical protein